MTMMLHCSSEPELLFSKKKEQGQIRKLMKGLLFEQSLNDKNFHLLENENQLSQFLHIWASLIFFRNAVEVLSFKESADTALIIG